MVSTSSSASTLPHSLHSSLSIWIFIKLAKGCLEINAISQQDRFKIWQVIATLTLDEYYSADIILLSSVHVTDIWAKNIPYIYRVN